MQDWKAYIRERLHVNLPEEDENDVVEELAQQLEDVYRSAREQGSSHFEARAEAQRQVPDWEELASEINRQRRAGIEAKLRSIAGTSERERPAIMASLLQDLLFTARSYARTPLLTLTAMATLMLGIGATTAMFSVVHAVLLRSLPYPNSDRLVMFHGIYDGEDRGRHEVSHPDFLDWEEMAESFEGLALGTYWTFNIEGPEAPERVIGMRVSGDFFSTLGISAALGRTLMDDDDRPSSPDTLVLSHGLWQRLYGGESDVVGRVLVANGQPHVIVGVMPPSFSFPSADVQMWGAWAGNIGGIPRQSRFQMAFGRLKSGTTIDQAAAEMHSLSVALQEKYPETNQGWSVELVPLPREMVGDVRVELLLLFSAVLVVLLIAVINLVNLLSAKMTGRVSELTIRVALGAGRARLIQQLLTENFILTGSGALLGFAFAYFSVEWLKQSYPVEIPRLATAGLNGGVLSFGVSLAVLTALVLAFFVALRFFSYDLAAGLKEGPRVASTRKPERTRRVLIAGQVALAVTLLATGGLLLQSFYRTVTVDPGFRTDSLLTMNVFLSGQKYSSSDLQKNFFREGLERLRNIPGVEQASLISHLPLSFGRSSIHFRIEGQDLPNGEMAEADYRSVEAGYFRVMDIPLIEGQALPAGLDSEDPPVAVVNQALARRYLNGDAVGKRIRWTQSSLDPGWITIIGVVDDIKAQDLVVDELPAAYIPYQQRTPTYLRGTAFVARARGDAMLLWPQIREEFQELDPAMPLYDLKTMEQIFQAQVVEERFYAALVGGFALLSLFLAATGIYGVISFWVSGRAAEIGLRQVLGAGRRRITAMVAWEGLLPVGVGLVCGLVLALLAGAWIQTLLFQTRPADPWTLTGTVLIVVVVSAIAIWTPVRRALSIDPAAALRLE